MTTLEHGIDRIRGLSRQAERRIRLGRALNVGAKALCVALAVAVVDVALRKLGLTSERWARVVLALGATAVLCAAAWAWVGRLPAQVGATALDRFHRLHDGLASALAFSGKPRLERTPFMLAAIEDAIAAAPHARPRAAVPIALPRALIAASGLAGLLALIAVFEVRTHLSVAHAATIEPVEMSADDLNDVKDFIQQLQQKDQSDDTRAAVEAFNKLIEDIANQRLDRTEAFRRMASLEQKLLSGSEADKKALEAQLGQMGEELQKAELTKPAGQAMSDAKLDQARDALHELAKRLRAQPPSAADKQRLDQMREALQRAAADAEKRQHAIEQRRKELADDILKREQAAQNRPDGGSDDDEQRLLRKKERELERLDRELDQQKNAGRQLDKLDRELQKAAEDLAKDMGLTAQDLDQGADDINHIQQQERTQEQKEELRQKLEEMRQLMRQGQGSKGRVMRLQRFGRTARGQAGGQQGQGQEGQGQEGQGGAQGQNGQQGQSGQQVQGGQGGHGGETWVLGPNGEKTLMLSKGGGGQGEGSGNGGEGQGQGGRGWGEGHDPKLQGGATNPKMGNEDTQVQGADTGQGGSRSQVILGAAERGFASRGYQKVYTEYHQVAEQSLAKDEIPGGYRFYVKRYFQLIRPRDDRE